MKAPADGLHFHSSGNIQEKGKKKKERNASDDYAGAAIGASILWEKSERGEVKFKRESARWFNTEQGKTGPGRQRSKTEWWLGKGQQNIFDDDDKNTLVDCVVFKLLG